MERVLPAGSREIAHRIESAVDRVEAQVFACPSIPEPAPFVRRDRHDFPDPLVLQIEVWQPLQRLDQLKTDVMDIAELFLHDEPRAQHEADRLLHALMLVDHLVGARVLEQA